MTRSIWLFQQLIPQDDETDLRATLRDEGRLERWGHHAQIPVETHENELFVVLKGSILIEELSTGRIQRLKPGDAFGATLSITTQHSPPTIRAHKDTTLSGLSTTHFLRLWQEHQITRKVLTGRWRNKQELQVHLPPLLGTLPVSRLALVLAQLAENYGERDGTKALLSMPLTRRQLAELAGLSLDQTRQALELLMKTNQIQWQSKSILIPNLDALRRLRG